MKAHGTSVGFPMISEKAGCGACCDGDVVEHRPYVQFRPSNVENQCDDEAQGAAVAGQTFISGEFPAAVGHKMDGYEHFNDVFTATQEVVGLVEQAVSQSGSDENTEETVDEERVEDVLRLFPAVFLHGPLVDFLLLEQLADDEIGECQSDEPAERVPSERSECQARIPVDKQFKVHYSSFFVKH